MVWRFFKENISPKQVKEHGHIMSFAAKWLGDNEIHYYENRKENDRKIVEKLVWFLDEADVVIAHNGDQFDLKEIRARAVVHGIAPPSPVKMVDTYKIAKKEFRFPSNSLAYLSDVLQLNTKKDGHKKFPGFELWLECLRNNEEAWDELKDYNIQDVLALEELYERFKPWATTHPNVAVYADPSDEVLCPRCGGNHVHWRGFAFTATGKYHRYQCKDCGAWGKGRYTILDKNSNLIVGLRT